ncbi:MAG: serine/threonine-protein kinase [Paracoccaceae bacterium]
MMQYQEDNAQASELPVGATLLQGQYEILQHLATGGFGMTYLARDSLSRHVVVKECFPDGLCLREGRLVVPLQDMNQGAYQKIVWNFVAEARRLAKLKHPNIVAVHQVFEENHTAYMAMDYVEGEELLSILEAEPKRLTPALLRTCLREALEAVAHLHEVGILHRDISPDNLLLSPDGHVTLIDFGAARERSQQSLSASTFLLAVKDGYSPHEFYVENAPQDASSDLYSLAATFYHLIAGEAPPDCWTRHEETTAGLDDPYVPLAGGGWPFERLFLKLIDQALSVDREDRIHSARDWIDWLDAAEADKRAGAEAAEAIVAEAPGPHFRPVQHRPAHFRPTELRAAAPAAEERPTAGRPKTLRADHFSEAAAEVDLQALSKLVASTNTEVATVKQAPRKKTREEVESERKASDGPKQLVDIYGDPVEDVNTWMKEQERVLKAKAAREAYASNSPNEDAPRRKSLIARLLTGGLRSSRNSATPV